MNDGSRLSIIPPPARSCPGGSRRVWRHSVHPEAGSTLVEVLIAIIVVVMVGLGVSQSVLTAGEVTRDADFTSTATLLLDEKLEELRQYAYDDADLAPGSHSEGQIDGYPEFTRQWTVEEDVPRAGLKRITVVVRADWENIGPPRLARAVTFRSSPAYVASIQP